jgi:DNA polymerase
MEPRGEHRRRVMVVGEGPGETEDERGSPWVGKAGRLLRDALGDLGVDLDLDCVSLNAVNCRPPKNRTPTGHEVACCRAKIVNPAISKYAPRIILLMGGSAVASVLGQLRPEALGASGGKGKTPAIGKWRGFTIPVPEWGAWVCPTYHPSYVLREEKRAEVETVWRQDVRRALGLVDSLVPPPEDLRSKVEVLRVEVDVLRAIYAAHESPLVSVDYETTGLRASLHEVVCASFASSPDRAHAFMMPKSGPIPGAWAALMARREVGKVSHNMRFEDSWTREYFVVEDVNWAWDSMLAAHVVDNRVGICGLKLQAFLYFGIQGWGDLIDPYLRAVDERDPSSPNRIREFIERHGEDECLTYCGIDSLVSLRLAMRQMEFINGKAAA